MEKLVLYKTFYSIDKNDFKFIYENINGGENISGSINIITLDFLT